MLGKADVVALKKRTLYASIANMRLYKTQRISLVQSGRIYEHVPLPTNAHGTLLVVSAIFMGSMHEQW